MPIIRSGYAPQDKRRLYGYNRAHWQRIRKARLSLDGHRCTIRLPGCKNVATTVDLDPRLQGNHDRATLETTRSACRACHGRVDGAGSRGGWGRTTG